MTPFAIQTFTISIRYMRLYTIRVNTLTKICAYLFFHGTTTNNKNNTHLYQSQMYYKKPFHILTFDMCVRCLFCICIFISHAGTNPFNEEIKWRQTKTGKNDFVAYIEDDEDEVHNWWIKWMKIKCENHHTNNGKIYSHTQKSCIWLEIQRKLVLLLLRHIHTPKSVYISCIHVPLMFYYT